MSEKAQIIRVFVSSPGDVVKERAVLDEAIKFVNDTIGQDRGARVEPLKWETDVVPQIGPPPQAVVDRFSQAAVC